MRATEIIRGVLDLIDQVEHGNKITIAEPIQHPMDSTEEIARYKQIVDLLPDSGESTEFANTANEKYANIDSVLVSGTDLLKSKIS